MAISGNVSQRKARQWHRQRGGIEISSMAIIWHQSKAAWRGNGVAAAKIASRISARTAHRACEIEMNMVAQWRRHGGAGA
jgi:hypothetical protein